MLEDVGGADKDANERQTGEEEGVGGAASPTAVSLTDLDVRINNDPLFHDFETLNTRVHSCAVCGCRLLKFAMEVHHHEIHKVHVQNDQDDSRV